MIELHRLKIADCLFFAVVIDRKLCCYTFNSIEGQKLALAVEKLKMKREVTP